jgi:Double-stranded DNA deaminase toxin A
LRAGRAGQGSTNPGSSGTSPTRPRSGAEPYRFEPVTPGFTPHSRTDPQLPPDLRNAGDGFLPRPPDTDRATVGHYDGRPITSGGPRSLADDLDYTLVERPDGRPMPVPPREFYRHAESVVAADMRARGLDSAEMVVDNTPCGSRQRDQDYPHSCDRLLPGMIPRGSTLTVWSTIDGGQTYYRKVYVGTGEYIRP